MQVQKIVEYPELGIAILHDEHGRFAIGRNNDDILDIDDKQETTPGATFKANHVLDEIY